MKQPDDNNTAQEYQRLCEASQRLLDLESPSHGPEREPRTSEWIECDCRNRRAFERVRSLRTALKDLKPSTRTELLGELAPRHRALHDRRWGNSGSLRHLAAAAGTLLAAIAIGIGLAPLHGDGLPAVHNGVTYATPKAQLRHIHLPDGTRVVLDADSVLRIAYGKGRRVATLVKGEVFFHVHHDAKHPFIVRAGAIQVRDLGTIFDVRKGADVVTVSVARGLVEVTESAPDPARAAPSQTVSSSHPSTTPVRVAAGQRIVAPTLSHTFHVSTTDAKDFASWRHGRLHFQDVPLSQVIARLNRYSRMSIRLANPEIGQRRFTGTIFVDHINDWLSAACQVFGLREMRPDRHRIVLYDNPEVSS